MRTQISLTAAQHRRAKQKAGELDISLAEYIRRLVDADLAEPSPGDDPSRIFGLGSSGGSDIAGDGDAAIREAVDALSTGRQE